MALDPERWKQRWVFWFIIDGAIAYDDKGWMFWLRTPLFAVNFHRNWNLFVYLARTNKIGFSLLAKWPTNFEGGKMYRWNWERERKA